MRTHERPFPPEGRSPGVRMRVRSLIGEPEPDAASRPNPGSGTVSASLNGCLNEHWYRVFVVLGLNT
jgi:hypothetical protein